MLPTIVNSYNHNQSQTTHLKTQLLKFNKSNISDNNNNSISQQNKMPQRQKSNESEQEIIEEEIKLPKIIINNMKKKDETINNSKSINHSLDTRQIHKSENLDSDYIDLYHNMSYHGADENKNFLNIITSISFLDDDDEKPENLNEQSLKFKQKLKKVQKPQKNINSPQPFLIPKDGLSTDTKISFNNLRLTCRDKTKNDKFKSTLKPKHKNLRGLNKSNYKDHEYLNSKTDSDIQFYLSSRNNVLNNHNLANYEQIMNNDKLKQAFNYKQMMYLKFNTVQSHDFDSYYNASKVNIMKSMKSPCLSEEHRSPRQLELQRSGGMGGKANAKIRSDYLSNSYYALKLPKLNVEENNGRNYFNLAHNILASTNDFQLQHDQIHCLTKELKNEIDKIVVHYPSISSKRTNGKFKKFNNVLRENLTKYENINNNEFVEISTSDFSNTNIRSY